MADALIRQASEDTELTAQAMLARSPRLSARKTGTTVNTIAGVGSTLKRDADRFALREIMRLFFQSARGADLDALALDRRQLSRHPATAATGSLLLTRTSSGTVTIPATAVFTDPDGGRYLSTSETVWGTSAGSVTVEIAAETAGADGNRTSGLLWSAGGADWTAGIASLIATNPEDLAGGNDAESDEQFRDRIYAWWNVQQRATSQALRYAALLVPGVRRATVDDTHVAAEDGGWVDVYISDGSDQANTTLGNQVKRELDNWKAAGVVVNVWGATVVYQGIQVSFVQAAGGPADAVARAVSAILTHVNNLAIGATLRRSQISRAGLSADASLLDCTVVSPAADVAPASGQVIRCRESEIESV